MRGPSNIPNINITIDSYFACGFLLHIMHKCSFEERRLGSQNCLVTVECSVTDDDVNIGQFSSLEELEEASVLLCCLLTVLPLVSREPQERGGFGCSAGGDLAT